MLAPAKALASLEPLSLRERGWGEGRAKRAVVTSPSVTTRLLLLLLLQLLRAGARAFEGAPGKRREAVESPAGLAARMRARFSTGQGWPVRKPRSTHANPLRRDAQRARTRGGLSLAYFSLATQREVGRAARRADRKLLPFALRNSANRRNRCEGGVHGGPGPTLFKPWIATTRRADRKLLPFASRDSATKRNRGEGGAHGGPGPTLCGLRSAPTLGAGRKLWLGLRRKAATP